MAAIVNSLGGGAGRVGATRTSADGAASAWMCFCGRGFSPDVFRSAATQFLTQCSAAKPHRRD
ncbi:hypothetical protein LG3211_3641 [Lysobacter gummosus]|nr:hypothetical protein LG3211_3641 [Lysobacter gummosus]